MQKQNSNSLEKNNPLKEKLFVYLKGLVKALIINGIIAGVFMIIGYFIFHSKFSTAAYSNALFLVAVFYMIYCYAVFQGDLNSRLDSSNLEMTSTRVGRNGSSQMIRDKFSRGESMVVIGSYTFATLGLAYLVGIL